MTYLYNIISVIATQVCRESGLCVAYRRIVPNVYLDRYCAELSYLDSQNRTCTYRFMWSIRSDSFNSERECIEFGRFLVRDAIIRIQRHDGIITRIQPYDTPNIANVQPVHLDVDPLSDIEDTTYD